jgi:hypothetical protein
VAQGNLQALPEAEEEMNNRDAVNKLIAWKITEMKARRRALMRGFWLKLPILVALIALLVFLWMRK